MKRYTFGFWLALFLIASVNTFAAKRPQRYALLLDEPAVVEQVASKGASRAATPAAEARVAASQDRVTAALSERQVTVTGRVGTLVNAIFVRGEARLEKELATIPGVQRVVVLRPIKRKLNTAIDLVTAPKAWDLSGGEPNAGLGMKIGIIDSGIDPSHPGMQDASLPPVPGGARCAGSDCNFTSNKIVAARSWANILDRPDDFSPRDRVGHGTAVAMVAAGSRNTGPAGTIAGVAPRAYLGNYKVFGSPGVNDVTYADVLTKALEAAFEDGMDVVTLSLGFPAEWAPQDDCGGGPCDPFARAVYNAVARGMSVVVAAGNEGESGFAVPTYTTISSPGTVTNAITVGATTNKRALYYGIQGEELERIPATQGDGPKVTTPLTAPMRDVSTLGNNGLACEPLTNGSLSGAIALIRTGTCRFSAKVNFAQKAGAVGVVLYRSEGNSLFPPTRLQETAIPTMLVGNANGTALKEFVASHADRQVTMDPTLHASETTADIVSTFSSLGPSILNTSIKPELVAPGTDIYTATQKYDANGDMYDPSGYTVIQGTSFSVPFVAGAVALVKQKNPGWTSAQLKSAVVNTANPNVHDTDDPSISARMIAMGAGKLDTESAVRTNLTVEPSTISFGAVSTVPLEQRLTFRNSSSDTMTLELSVKQDDADNNARVVICPGGACAQNANITLSPGVSDPLSVQLQGSRPKPGMYEGVIEVTGGAVTLRIPYIYVVGDGEAHNVVPLSNYDFNAVAGNDEDVDDKFGPLSFKVIDRYGVPVQDVDVLWRVVQGSGDVEQTSGKTDSYGIAEATVIRIGPEIGEQVFRAELLNTTLKPVDFIGVVRIAPAFETAAVANAASGRAGAQAPGSYISIFGRGLADTFSTFRTPFLPLSLAGVNVSFDVPGKVAAPGRLSYVSDGQVNVQVPWELAGQSGADIWLTVGGVSTKTQRITLGNVSPAAFECPDGSTGRSIGCALDTGFHLIDSANPARKGEYIQVYANGLGPVYNTPASGDASSADPLSGVTESLPEVTIGGKPGEVYFAGLAPYFVGLYQINVKVPTDAGTGYQPVVIKARGIESKSFNVPVQ